MKENIIPQEKENALPDNESEKNIRKLPGKQGKDESNF